DDVESRAISVDDQDVAAVIDLDVIRHIAAGRGVGVALGHVEANFLRRLWLADIPRAHAASEVGEERQPPVVWVAEVLFARMHAKTGTPHAVVAARPLLAIAR